MYLHLVNILAQNPLRQYITDGLIFRLDGIDIGSDPSAWTDLVGNIKFTPNNVTRGTNCFIFDGSSSYMVGDKKVPLVATNDTYTIEIVMSVSKTGTNYIFNGGTGTDIHFVDNGQLTIRASSNTAYSNSNNSILSTYSINHSSGYKNKVALSQVGTDYWSDGGVTNAFIGGGTPGRRFGGSIYAIRIYNRILTQEEVLLNQQSDILRFGITI